MTKILYIVIITLLISSCQSKYDFVPVEEFEIVKNKLSDHEQVEVLYYCPGPYDEDVEQGFYRQAIVVSIETRDTLNVLTFPNSELGNLTLNDNLLFFNNRPNVKKAVGDFESLPEEMKEILENIDTTKVSWPKYTIVAKDPADNHITNNNYLAVIGSLTDN
jgi:hypothetical protein